MRSVTLNFADWLEAIFWRSFWHILWHSFCYIFWHIFWHSFWHLFWHSFWHIFCNSFWHMFWHAFWHIFWHSFWHIFWRAFWHIFWHSFWHIQDKKHSIHSFTHKPLHKLYIYLTPRSKLCACQMAILQLHSIASDRPAKKQLSPKMQKAYVCIYTWHASDSPANQKQLSPKMPCKWAHSRNYISWRVSTMKPDACHCGSFTSSV